MRLVLLWLEVLNLHRTPFSMSGSRVAILTLAPGSQYQTGKYHPKGVHCWPQKFLSRGYPANR